MQHGDRLGYLVFSEHQHIEYRPARGKRSALHFIQQLVRHTAWDAEQPPLPGRDHELKALIRLRQVTRPGSLVILLSDFRFLEDQCRRQLVELSRHNDIVMLHTSDPFERDLPDTGRYQVTDNNRMIEFDAASETVRSNYQLRYQEHQENLKRVSDELGLFLIDVSTDDDVAAVLKSGLGLPQR